MNAYAYRALEGPEYIRLIVLHPALSKATPLRIDFVSSKLEDVEGDYDAVSYTWGEPVLTFPLYVGEDGMQVYVTENLDRALRYLRYETRERLLWADAACINQKDNEEKAIQIPLMVQIFRGARKVMAWLDPGGDTTAEQKGMRLLGHLSRLSNSTTEESHRDFSKILQFLNLPWFNRLWIVQEVVFNLEVCLICGETELPFSRLVRALPVIERQGSWHNPDDKAKLEAIVEIGKLWSYYSLSRKRRFAEEYWYTGGVPLIFHLLGKFGLYKCTDPRDRIFALCSMTNDARPIEDSGKTDRDRIKHSSSCTGYNHLRVTDESLLILTADYRGMLLRHWHRVPIDIDYSLDVRETYEAFALACLTENITTGAIWEALIRRQHSPPPMNWPSWVPDWRVPLRIEGRYLFLGKSPDYNSRKIATGILRVSVPVTRYIMDGKEKQLYTVNFKISKETKDPQMSFESQLLRLYQMSRMPETVQGPHHLPIESASTPRKLNRMKFPNLLTRMIKQRVHRYKSDPIYRGVKIHSKLKHYLSRMSIQPNLRGSSEPSYDYIRGFIEQLAHNLSYSDTLFCLRDSGTGLNSVGYGSAALELGDSLLPMYSHHRVLNGDDLEAEHMFIIRPVYTIEESDGEKQIYKLVGDAYIFDPTAVLMRMEYKEQRKARRATQENTISLPECQEFDQVVYLA